MEKNTINAFLAAFFPSSVKIEARIISKLRKSKIAPATLTILGSLVGISVPVKPVATIIRELESGSIP
jgi:hypothetical protein